MASNSNSRTRSASSSSSSPPAKRQKITVAPFAAAFPRRTLLSSSRWVNLPEHVWIHQILNPFLDLKALSTVGRSNTFFEEYWQYVLKQNVIQVPEGCPTMNEAMDMAVIFSERNECSIVNPIKIEVGAGEHEMVGVDSGTIFFHTSVSCNNITIVGKGKGKTTILGGFYVGDKQNVKIEQLAVTNGAGSGLYCKGSGTNVNVMECSFTKCSWYGMLVQHGATATATRCEFMENVTAGVASDDVNTKVRLNDASIHHNNDDGSAWCGGLLAFNCSIVDLHGTRTDIHSNKHEGIWAAGNAKVNIHLPSQHNTTHDNEGDNRRQLNGGSIANINADGTFTHADELEFDEDDY
jgi:hypothetical protein